MSDPIKIPTHQELKRWFFNPMNRNLHRRISNRGITFENHYRTLRQELPPLTKNRLGSLKQLSRDLLKDPDINPQLRANCLAILKK